jgi:hypothetical protein
MTTIIRNYEDGQLISDANTNDQYTYEELDGGVFLDSDDDTGAETFRLTDERIVTIQSIDLDWVRPFEDAVLRTTSAPKKYTITYEQVFHHLHEVTAGSLEEAERLFESNQSVCVDTQETWNTTDIEEVIQ